MSMESVIDLAPGHKVGFVARSPVLLAGGVVGLGETVPGQIDTKRLGAIVVGPLQRHPQAGVAPPRLAEAPGQFVLNTGLQNRGLNATLKRYTRYWTRLGSPVVVQLADRDLHFLEYVVARMVEHEVVGGFELLVPRLSPQLLAEQRNPGRRNQRQHGQAGDPTDDVTNTWIAQAVQIIDERSDLPVWVKLPIEQAAELAPVAVAAGAKALVIGRPPLGTLFQQQEIRQDVSLAAVSATQAVRGELFGPSTFPLMMNALIDVVQQALPAAIIACGGIHTVAQAKQVLAVGATALQLDSAVWIEPGIVELMCDNIVEW